MVRKLSLGSRRRWSKASRDGSLSENIAKADIRASAKGISTSPDRGSGREPKWERSRPEEGVGGEILACFTEKEVPWRATPLAQAVR